MNDWTHGIGELVARHGAVARVVIVDVSGPTPRPEGASMLVTATGREGKIGRGTIERDAIAIARRLITEAMGSPATGLWLRSRIEFPTGPVLGETSDGLITLLVEVFTAHEVEALREQRAACRADPVLARPFESGIAPTIIAAGEAASDPLWREAAPAIREAGRRMMARLSMSDGRTWLVERLTQQPVRFQVYGTGLVARALVPLLAGLPFEVIWYDSEPANFPAAIDAKVRIEASRDLPALARRASPGSFHAVMTASHELDLEVCQALLDTRSFAYLGVIGSKLKRQRLVARLESSDINPALLARIACPIGLPEIRSKSPEVIAISIAAQALVALQHMQDGGAGQVSGAGPGSDRQAGSDSRRQPG